MKKILLAALTVMVAVSCMKTGHNSASWQRRCSGELTTEIADSHEQVYTAQNVSALLDWFDTSKKMFNFTFEDVQFIEGMQKQSVCLPNIPFEFKANEDENVDQYDWVINSKDVIPTVGGVPYEAYKMRSVKGLITGNNLKMELWLTLNGTEYHVTYVYEIPVSWEHSYSGKLTTILEDGSEPAYNQESVSAHAYCSNLSKQVLTFDFINVRFVEAMPQLSITLPNLPFVKQTSDTDNVTSWIIDQKDVVPTIGGVPYENYKMSEVKGSIDDDSVVIEFWLTLKGGKYHVTYQWHNSESEGDI